jgi:hypothetical protein
VTTPADIAATVSATGDLPLSFASDSRLFALNLFLMTAFTCLGGLVAAKMARALWRSRHLDRLRAPVSVWRLAWLFAGLAACVRCGTEAVNLWAWNPADAETTALVLMAKRWIDPLALLLAGGWMTLVTLASPGMEAQLRREPHPVPFWASLPELRRPAAIVLLSFAAAVGVAVTR